MEHDATDVTAMDCTVTVRTMEIAYRPDLHGTMKALAALRKEWEAR